MIGVIVRRGGFVLDIITRRGCDDTDLVAFEQRGEEAVLLTLDSRGKVRWERSVPLGRAPTAIAAERGVVWVVDADARTVSRLAGSSRVIDVVSTGATPLDLAVGSGSPWVVNGRRRQDVGFTGPVATGVVRLEPATGTERAEVPLRTRTAATSNRSDNHITVRGTGVWVVTPYYEVVRIETSTGVITTRQAAERGVGGEVLAFVW